MHEEKVEAISDALGAEYSLIAEAVTRVAALKDPFAGLVLGLANAAFGAVGKAKRAEQVNAWLVRVAELLQLLDEEKLEKDYLDSDEWFWVFTRTAEEAARATERGKLDLFANFLANGMVRGAFPGYRERTLNLVAQLQLGHVMVLRDLTRWEIKRPAMLHSHQGARPAGSHADRFGGMSRSEALGFLADLEALSLAKNVGQHQDGESEELFPWFVITGQGWEVLDWIAKPGTEVLPGRRPSGPFTDEAMAARDTFLPAVGE